ncbi:MAG: ABC transporter ATP-binding protein [Lawsonibacter sp.]|nr:ABC transporter ATP-binding protein [Lawsonibacter sp.]
MEDVLLNIRELYTEYNTDHGLVQAVNGVSLKIRRGETLGLVGETGAGKTTTALSILRLIPDPPGRIKSGQVFLGGQELTACSEKEMQKIRGNRISMIFQDPMTALNPVLSVGEQISEVVRLHEKCSRVQARERGCRLLELVGIPANRYKEFPHQFSGGMKQRVVIAIALACTPELLIADEPTTALDVTIQAQVLELIANLQEKTKAAVLLITHDLGVVAEVCRQVAIMYAGEIVEYGSTEEIYSAPSHPYTIGLFRSIPSVDQKVRRLQPIAGLMPDPTALGPGCPFAPRCPKCSPRCQEKKPPAVELEGTHQVKCWLFASEEEVSL